MLHFIDSADVIIVNSLYTKSVFHEAFPRVTKPLRVVYPCVNISQFDKPLADITLGFNSKFILSINRFERKKNIQLGLEAFGLICNRPGFKRLRLVLAGGYDIRLKENVEVFKELQSRVSELQLDGRVTFIKSVPNETKLYLLHRCECVVYTPTNEHFGIVPVEAMCCGKPVIAVNSGGPTESIVAGETGLLCNPDAVSFADALIQLLSDKHNMKKFGEAGRRRVESMFSQTAMCAKFWSCASP